MRKLVLVFAFMLLSILVLNTSMLAADKIIIYSSVDEANAKKILDAFSAQNGIEVDFVHLSSGPAMARITAEANNPQADVWLGAPSENHVVLKGEGLTVSYQSEAMENLAPSFKDPDGFWRCFYMNPIALAINTEALTKAGIAKPTSWEDLLKPEYEDLIQMPTPQASGTAYTIMTTLITIFGEDEAFEYMKKLNPNIQTYTSSGTGPSKGVAVGQCAIGIQFTPAFFEFIEEGYPLEVIFPSEGVGFEAPAVSIIKGAKNLESAKILLDWLVSKDGQDVLSAEKTFFYPVNPEAELSEGMPAFSELKTIEVDSQWAGENKERLVERWVNKVLTAK